MDDFLKHWFSGFQTSLSNMDEPCRNQILGACGRACSDSYPMQAYLNAKSKAGSEDAFIAELKKAFPELRIEVIEKSRKFAIEYTFCACDLVGKGYISDPSLCECSRSSLQYNWEAIYGQGNVAVEMIQTILSGAHCCRFILTLY